VTCVCVCVLLCSSEHHCALPPRARGAGAPGLPGGAGRGGPAAARLRGGGRAAAARGAAGLLGLWRDPAGSGHGEQVNLTPSLPPSLYTHTHSPPHLLSCVTATSSAHDTSALNVLL
jgi:hypothetical protein